MKKIVELVIKLDDIEFNNLGGDALALVENPAIELDFLAFNREETQYVDIFGYSPNHFDICPAASSLFQHLVDMQPEEEERGMIRSAALQADKIFEIEKRVIELGKATESDLTQATLLANDFTDLMKEIDEALQMSHDVSWMMDHIETIASYYKREEMSIDTSQLPQYVDELDDEQKWILSQCEQMGEEYDPQKAIFIDASKASFSTLRDFLEGITALDILGRRGVTNEDQEGVEVYRYAGPSAERGFCRAMLRLNKVYREEELSSLNRANPGFGENGSNNYNVFEYKGGPNCRHYFERLQMFKDGRETIFVSQGPADGDAGKTNNNNAPSSAGAVENNARLNFSIEEDQRIVVGPAMVPTKMIKRIDEDGLPYYVYFTKQTVNDIAEKFLGSNKQNMTNVEHNKETITNANTLLESWIVEDTEMDKAKLYGFNVPEGTWMVKYRINDDETWQKIKEGKLRGFSIEGYFISRAEAMDSADNVVEDIIDILSKVED